MRPSRRGGVDVDGAAGPTRVVGPAVELGASPAEIRAMAPELGQHTYGWDEITSLRDERVIL